MGCGTTGSSKSYVGGISQPASLFFEFFYCLNLIMKLCSSIAFYGVVGVGALVLPERSNEKRSEVNIVTDISEMSRSWGQLSTYVDNPDDYFGVEAVGLPDGCQIVSAFP